MIIAFYLTFGNRNDKVSRSKLENLLKQIKKDYFLIVIDNSPNATESRLNNQIHISGSNKNWEFGGWQEGIETAKSELDIENITGVIFCNDTFCTHRKFEILDQLYFSFLCLVSRFLPLKLAVAEISTLSETLTVEKRTSNKWLASYLIFLNKSALNAIDWRVQLDNYDNYISSNTHTIFSTVVDTGLADYITSWLTDTNSENRWYNAQRITEKNVNFMKLKGLQILQEKYLHAIMCEKGITILDYRNNYLRRIMRRLIRILT